MGFLNTDSCTFVIGFELSALVVFVSMLYGVISFSNNYRQSSDDFLCLEELDL